MSTDFIPLSSTPLSPTKTAFTAVSYTHLDVYKRQILPPYDNSYGQNTKMSARNLLLLKIQFIINILQDWTSGIF